VEQTEGEVIIARKEEEFVVGAHEFKKRCSLSLVRRMHASSLIKFSRVFGLACLCIWVGRIAIGHSLYTLELGVSMLVFDCLSA
jgi:hypothetical protein